MSVFPLTLKIRSHKPGRMDGRVTLRWSKEALASAANEMTFWYMEQVGEIIYAKNRPDEWTDMSPAEAGSDAAKMMLYYAILRCNTARENQRAIALYNSYGFGFALGMNFIIMKENARCSGRKIWMRSSCQARRSAAAGSRHSKVPRFDSGFFIVLNPLRAGIAAIQPGTNLILLIPNNSRN